MSSEVDVCTASSLLTLMNFLPPDILSLYGREMAFVYTFANFKAPAAKILFEHRGEKRKSAYYHFFALLTAVGSHGRL